MQLVFVQTYSFACVKQSKSRVRTWSQIPPWVGVFTVKSHCDIQHYLIAVRRSTQSSMLVGWLVAISCHGRVECVKTVVTG